MGKHTSDDDPFIVYMSAKHRIEKCLSMGLPVMDRWWDNEHEYYRQILWPPDVITWPER